MQRQRGKKNGQALVLVSLGLFAMCGLMGLAVDFGWSFFVEKQAQAAADTIALGAVQEAMSRLGSTAGFTCPVAPSGPTAVYCAPTPVTCTSLSGATTNNLWNGCLYGTRNSFTDGSTAPPQVVTVQANDASALPPLAPGVNDISYWVTARTTQTVPQLFSAVLGNGLGVVSASATAAIAASITPGSFYALNREGDCIATEQTNRQGFNDLCGVDVRVQGGAGQPAPVCAGSGGVQASICAADGIYLSSTCHGDGTQTGCSDPGGGGKGGSNNWAGQTGGSGGNGSYKVWSNGALVRDDPVSGNTGAVDTPSHWDPAPVPSSDPSPFHDPFEGDPQPSIAANAPISMCGIEGGVINGSGAGPLLLGPYQYYSFHYDAGGNPVADGDPIRVSGDVEFSSAGLCQSGGLPAIESVANSPLSNQFPVYMFYGGLNVAETTHFGAGQYVMVGTKDPQNSPAFSFSPGVNTITGDTTIGTQFITTSPVPGQNDASEWYPGLKVQYDALFGIQPSIGGVTLNQGNIEIKSGASSSAQLQGIDRSALPGAVSYLADYDGSLFWQDRLNSTIVYDSTGHLVDRPCANGCDPVDPVLTANGVSEWSPEFIYDAAVQLDLNGHLYQSRGSWFSYQGNADIASGLRIITGMVYMRGNGQMSLLPTATPIIKYVVALIQ